MLRDANHRLMPEPPPQPHALSGEKKKKKKKTLSKINARGAPGEMGAAVNSSGKARVWSC